MRKNWFDEILENEMSETSPQDGYERDFDEIIYGKRKKPSPRRYDDEDEDDYDYPYDEDDGEYTPKEKGHFSKGQSFLLASGVALVLAAAFMAFPAVTGYVKDRSTYDDARESYTSSIPEMDADNLRDLNIDVTSVPDWYDLAVDFDSLHGENSEVIGWITADGLPISYPLMQSKDNEYYLTHDLNFSESNAGSIFLDSSASPTFSDAWSIIYGHNMKDRSMFGSLKSYRDDEDFYGENGYFTIYTRYTAYRYRIFAYGDLDADDSLYSMKLSWGDEFNSVVKSILHDSLRDTGVTVREKSHIVTLSTCSGDEETRFTVHGVLVDEYQSGS